jgi:hypothetical protein
MHANSITGSSAPLQQQASNVEFKWNFPPLCSPSFHYCWSESCAKLFHFRWWDLGINISSELSPPSTVLFPNVSIFLAVVAIVTLPRHPSIPPCVRSSCLNSLNEAWIHSLTHLFIYPSIRLSIHSSIHSLGSHNKSLLGSTINDCLSPTNTHYVPPTINHRLPPTINLCVTPQILTAWLPR